MYPSRSSQVLSRSRNRRRIALTNSLSHLTSEFYMLPCVIIPCTDGNVSKMYRDASLRSRTTRFLRCESTFIVLRASQRSRNIKTRASSRRHSQEKNQTYVLSVATDCRARAGNREYSLFCDYCCCIVVGSLNHTNARETAREKCRSLTSCRVLSYPFVYNAMPTVDYLLSVFVLM